MGILSKLFGKPTKGSEQPGSESIDLMNAFDGMALDDILAHVGQLGNKFNIRIAYALWKRAFEIALLDNRVPDNVREKAYVLAEAVEKDLKNAPQSSEARSAMEGAMQNWKDRVKHVGVGSLFWLAEEQKVPSDQLVDFMLRPDHGALLANALAVLGDGYTKARPEMVRELIKTRRGKVLNSVVALFGCASVRDPATEALFPIEDLNKLRFAHRNYNAARSVLVELGLLPNEAVGLETIRLPDIGTLEYPLMMLVKEALDGAEDSEETKQYVSGLSEQWRQTFRIASALLSLGVILGHVRWLYGEEGEKRISEYFKKGPMRSTWGGEYEQMFNAVITAEERIYASPRVSPGFAAFDWMLSYGKTDQTEEEYNLIAEQEAKGGKLLDALRLVFFEKLRFMIRQYSPEVRGSEESERRNAANDSRPMFEDYIA